MTQLRVLALLTALVSTPLITLAQTAAGPVPVAAEVMSNYVMQKAIPVYPQFAKAQHVSGSVVMDAIISKDGRVQSLKIISGPEMLRASAMESARQWVYQPYMVEGQAVEVRTTITINYSLGEDAVPPPAGSLAPGKPAGAVRIAGGVVAGMLLSKVAPRYPEEAKANHISGMVVMHAVIAKDGTIDHLTVISGPDELRDAATDAVSQWLYRPYLLNGEPVEVDTTITVNFNFGSAPAPR